MNVSWRELLRGVDLRIVGAALALALVGVLGISLAISFGRAPEELPAYGLVQLRWLVVGLLLFLAAPDPAGRYLLRMRVDGLVRERVLEVLPER